MKYLRNDGIFCACSWETSVSLSPLSNNPLAHRTDGEASSLVKSTSSLVDGSWQEISASETSSLLGGYHLLSAVESSQHSYFAHSKVRFRTRLYRKTKVAMHARMDC